MRIATILLLVLLALGALTVYALLQPQPDQAAGYPHPEYATMLRGGDGLVRQAPVYWVGAVIGVLELVFFIALLAFGLDREGRGRPWLLPLSAGLGVFIATWLPLVFTYRTYAASPLPLDLALSFPIPTAWMLFGVGFAPIIFIALYALRFDSWVISDAEIERFLQEAPKLAQSVD